jgi:hypothetical protein
MTFEVLAVTAYAGTMVFVKRNDVWISQPEGSRQIRLTTNGTRDSPYASPSIADDGTIVALRRITLHSFRPTGRRVVRPRRWAVLTQRISTEPIDVDLSPNGRIVATDNLLYSVFYDPRISRNRPEVTARFVDFNDFRTNRTIGETDTFYDYGSPAWIGARRVLTTSYGLLNPQVLAATVGRRTRGAAFYHDPGRDPSTGGNTFILADAEATRAGDRFAVMRRPLLGADADDVSVGTIQVYRTGSPPTASTPLCAIGPGRRIDQAPDPSWSPDGRTLLWHEPGRGIYAARVTSRCGRPRLVVRGGLSPDLSRANLPRRRR